MISEDLRQSWLDRAHGLEDSIRRLAGEIIRHLQPELRQAKNRLIRAKIDVLFSELERTIVAEAADDAVLRDARIERVQDLSDELIAIRAEIDRKRREVSREGQDLELDARRLRHQQLRDELDAEFGG